MKAAVIDGPGLVPVYAEFAEPQPRSGQELIDVSASALSPAARAFAAGAHFGATAGFPRVAGIDGVGITAAGQRVYFVMPQAPFGGMAQRTVVASANCVPLTGTLTDAVVAAIANPGISSMAALNSRAELAPGDIVLINGATGAAGQLAVQVAKRLGAGKVIATGRNPEALRRLQTLGADVTISLQSGGAALEDSLSSEFRDGGVDVVLDYLFGERGEMLLAAIAKSRQSRPLRYVVVGGAVGQEITLQSSVLRAVPVSILGSGLGSVPWSELMSATAGFLQIAESESLHIDIKTAPLARVGEEWHLDAGKARLVFVTSGH